MKRALAILSMCFLAAGLALAGESNASNPAGPVKRVKVVNDILNVQGEVDATVSGPIGVDVLTLPPGTGGGPIEGATSIQVNCSTIGSLAVGCSEATSSFPAGATRMLVFGVYGYVTHTEAGTGISGAPGGLCEGTLSVGGEIIGTWAVMPEQTQVISREFSSPLAVPLPGTLASVTISSAATSGGPCQADMRVLASFEN